MLSGTQGQAAWMLYVDIFCLAADGGIFDAALAAAVAALSNVKLPRVKLSEDGRVVVAEDGSTEASPGPSDMDTESGNGGTRIVEGCSRLNLASLPIALTCGMYKVDTPVSHLNFRSYIWHIWLASGNIVIPEGSFDRPQGRFGTIQKHFA
jgi:exosome complex RNA-binding protein Rrp42 (RNase PH superfamily)